LARLAFAKKMDLDRYVLAVSGIAIDPPLKTLVAEDGQ
jgi:hypothetical protein